MDLTLLLVLVPVLLVLIGIRDLFRSGGRDVLPFVVADVVRLGILIAFPIISLWLPSMMG